MLNELIKTIPSVKLDFYWGTKLYNLIENQLIKVVENYFGHGKSNKYSFEEIGEINLPFFSMGSINTTGNHISGAKTPYGETEKFAVEALPFKETLNQYDSLKIDAERQRN